MSEENKIVRHIVGHGRTLQTVVLMHAYIEKSHVGFGMFEYEFSTPNPENGYWTGTVLCVPFKQGEYGSLNTLQGREMSDIVRECRAFSAGRGEIWA